MVTMAASPPAVTPIPEPTASRLFRAEAHATTSTPSVAADWQAFVDEKRGLSIFYPPGWLFFDPTEDDLTTLLAEMGEQANTDAIGELLTTLTDAARQEDLFVGLGFQVAPHNGAQNEYASGSSPGLAYANNITAISLSAAGLPLHLYAQLVAAQLDGIEGIDVEGAEVIAGLRPRGAEVASIRYRADGALYNLPGLEIAGWQVGVLSPDAETFLVLTFGMRGDDFAELEPLLGEIVQRVRWSEQIGAEQPVGPVVTINRSMNVRSGPGADYPVIGTASAGQQFPIVGKDPTGDWWQIDADGQIGWVAAQYVIPANAGSVQVIADLPTPVPPRPVPVVLIHNPLVIPIGDTPGVSEDDWQRFDDRARGLALFYPPGPFGQWFFVPTQDDLPSLVPRMGDQAIAEAVVEELAAYISLLAPEEQEDQFGGLGFLFDPASALVHIDQFTVFTIPAADLVLEQYAQLLAAQLEGTEGVEVESAEVVAGLRPQGEEAASIRYRSGGVVVSDGAIRTMPGTDIVGWQVVLLSPDGETFLVIAFDVFAQKFTWLEPLLSEIVRRVQWGERAEPPVGPMVTINRTMNVRGGPGAKYPVIGTATAGQQYAAIGKNVAGAWWQIEYDAQIGWVFGQFVTPTEDATRAPAADQSGWRAYEDEARGLALFYPPGWHYFDPAQPSQADLMIFSAEKGERLDVDEMDKLVSSMSGRRHRGAVIGLGLQLAQSSNNLMLVFSFPADGLTLDRYSQLVGDQLQKYGFEEASEVALGLRPLSEKAVSIRYREYGAGEEIWQVWLLSPDAETFFALTFSIRADEFAELEPLLAEIVRRVRWAE